MGRRGLAVLLAVALTMSHADAAEPIRVFAAGSLRAPLTVLAQSFEKSSGAPVHLVFGASGLLRDRIVAGEAADVFASANMEHPEALRKAGWATAVVAFTRNQLCALSGPKVPLATANALDVMLDPAIKLGTSTPKADPSGDYAWALFERAEKVRPGAYDTLSAKALQLTGGPQSPAPPANRNVYGVLVETGQADVFLTYCTNAQIAVVEVPALRLVKLPAALSVGADYGVAVRTGAPTAARAFVDYLRSPEGQGTFARFGFDPP
jgi:molybdenum ABC transporter molybdate-binding protein